MNDEGCREKVRPLLARCTPLVDEYVGEWRRRVADVSGTRKGMENAPDHPVYRCWLLLLVGSFLRIVHPIKSATNVFCCLP